MPTGTVSNWNFPKAGRRNSEGFGFVRVDGDKGDAGDLFLYADSIKDPKLRSEAKLFGLKNRQRIRFDIEEPASARKSRLAINVTPLRDEDDDGGGRRNGRSRSRSLRLRRSRSAPPRRSRSPPLQRRADSRRRSPPRRMTSPRRSPPPRARSPPRGRARADSRADSRK
eukprot:TRINITY_DN66523_c0_g1_i1.p2 TRINITY_DN66523_c0_g1~~TRINITY_DN66523_c0_g1_i1.p2  ORF type:complete len:169 (+),score=17.32 TRINITY_DN66523_c0_g1_i1:103-609(+)